MQMSKLSADTGCTEIKINNEQPRPNTCLAIDIQQAPLLKYTGCSNHIC